MKIAELRTKGKEELGDLVLSLKKEQFNLRMQRATGALEGQGRFKEARRTIARAKTLMNEKVPSPQRSPGGRGSKKNPLPPGEGGAKRRVRVAKAKKEKE
ncbi:MAG: 50S ribosomal protein L29 [Pseudomonadota bacterium]|nr:50S ribosomal protein L29 [Pseudomonadota bacterium]MDE3037863.1 50S ribosomal protein L29 [Pseudomonadota bacterium]